MLLLVPVLLAADPFPTAVKPFLETYCTTCHGGDKPKGGLDTSSLAADFKDAAVRAKWGEVANVLNSHEMPPKKHKTQPTAKEVADVVDWITAKAVEHELKTREKAAVLRRLNRDEYRNTVRDLLGVDYDPAAFPQDPPAGGFDNNGRALTVSPLHMELYLNAARQILDRALVDGERPAAVKWRFNPTVAAMDRVRQRLDAKNNPIVNGGNNGEVGDFVRVHHNSWDKGVGARDFRVPTAGTYIIRLRAAGRVPARVQVVESAEKILAARKAEQLEKNPKGAKYHEDAYTRDLEHFRTDRMYDYGPARAKLVMQLGPTPRTVAEFDVAATEADPKVYEFPVRFTTESAGIHFEYAYAIPSVLENFWMQGKDAFARPELLIDWFEVEGPVYDAWPPASHTRLLFDSPKRNTDERGYAQEVLAKFLRKAFRRPVADAEIASKLALFDKARKELPFLDSIKLALSAVLASPHFLYLAEPAGEKPRKLNDHELAAKLSYFLWSTTPDAELDSLADAGKLRSELPKQIDRMIADPKCSQFVKNFAGQWLGLRDVGANPPAADLFPHYDRHLEVSMVREGEEFFREVLLKDRPTSSFLKSEFVVVNERLARFYGLDGVRADDFRAVPAAGHRGGAATFAAVLCITSNGTRTSPVKRGTWVLKTLLDQDPGLPVANAGEISPKVPGIDKATVRQRLEAHRALDQCARCHAKIDPIGFGLENFDACGAWRDREGFGYKGRVEKNDPKVDAAGLLPDGTKIDGADGLRDALLKREDQFRLALTKKVLTYALGRETGLADRPTIAALAKDAGTLRALIKSIAASDAFQMK